MCETLQLNWKLPSGPNTRVKNKNAVSKIPNNNNVVKPTKKSKKGSYTLRACSIKKRVETDTRKGQPKKRGPKPRPRPLPMSKYRRKTANLRERERMGEINNAFENLREKIPAMAIAGKGKCEKMTKINVLHVAINYIRALENILETGDAGVNVYGTAVVQSPFLPLAINPDPETPVASSTPLIKSNKRKQKEYANLSSCHSSSSGSEDSGIAEDEDANGSGKEEGDSEEGGDDEDENNMEVDEDCPDWTELTCTLDFPPLIMDNNNSITKKLLPSSPPASTLYRGNLDTLLTTLSSATTAAASGCHPDEKRVLQTKVFNRQVSFSEFLTDNLGQLDAMDLFSDLSSGLDVFTGLDTIVNEENSFPIF